MPTWSEIAALLTGAAAIVTSILMYRKNLIILEQKMADVQERLKSHNAYAEKFTETKNDIADIKTDVAIIKTALSFVQKEAEKK